MPNLSVVVVVEVVVETLMTTVAADCVCVPPPSVAMTSKVTTPEPSDVMSFLT